MAGMTIDVRMPSRRAEVRLNRHQAERYGLPHKEPATCHVLGLFQNYPSPVFICELNDGNVIEAAPTSVKFVDTENGYIK